MESYLKEALGIVKAQAGFRVMTEEEIASMIKNLAVSLKSLAEGVALPAATPEEEETAGPIMDPKKAVRERTIVCLESGKSFKVLTRKHLAKFGLTPEQYREKYGYPKNMPLVCKALQRERRKKMQEMKLWEKRGKGKKAPAETPAA